MSRFLHRALRQVGLHLQRWHDPYRDVQQFLGGKFITQIVDGGAYNGSLSERLASMFPSATVHAFEPQPELFAAISRRTGMQKQIRPHQLALSDRAGESTFYVNQQAFTSSLLKTTEPGEMKPTGTIEVRTGTLDGWAEEERTGIPDLIKLDLQGHELPALRGAQRLLASGVKALLVEVNFRRRYEGCCLFHEVAHFVGERDFELVRLYEIIADPDGSWRQADALFLHRSVRRPTVA
jgi:FkbM family methyltransferase